MSLLTLDRVSKRFGGITAVEQVSFQVDRGQVVGFLGPNGAGKSTTMRMITQFIEPDAGSIKLDGVSLDEAGREAKRRIGYLPENNPLYPEMLVSEYLDFVGRLRELDAPLRQSAIDEAVHATGLEPVFHRPIGELGRERTVLLSTHVLPEVQFTCSRLLIINGGRIVADGPVGELITRAKAATRIAVEAAGHEVAARLAALPGAGQVEAHESSDGRVRVIVTASGAGDLRPRIFELAKAEQWTLFELHQEAGSLEDLFRELTIQQEP